MGWRVGNDHLPVMKFREVIELLEADGWVVRRVRGSHRQFKHPVKEGLVTVAGKESRDVPPGTLNAIPKWSSS